MRAASGPTIGVALLAAAVLVASALVVLPAAPAGAGSLPVQTRLVSRDAAGGVVKGAVSDVAISGNGRFVAFVTGVAVVAADTNGDKDVYVRDRWAATTELVTMTDTEQPVDGDSSNPTMSDDGRFVSFRTTAPNLIPNDDKGFADAFVRDRYEGTTKRVAPGLGGALLNAAVDSARLSGDGYSVAFSTSANNVVVSDTNAKIDVFVRDLLGSDIERVSVSALDGQSGENSANPTLSDDGRYVAFDSQALLAGGVIDDSNVFVRDRTAGTTELVSLKNDDSVGDAGAASASISGSGRYVAFASQATNLVTGDTNDANDVFVRDRTAGTTVRVSLTDADAQIAVGGSSLPASIADSGTAIAFSTTGQATSAPDAGADQDVYLRDTVAGTTRRVTTGPSLADPAANQFFGSIDDSGQDVAFSHPLRLTAEQTFDQAYVSGPVTLGPFASSSALIQQQYTDFLGRSATAGEISTWSGRFTAGSSSPSVLAATLVADPIFAAKRAPLVRLYWAFFLRRPDPSGLNYWLGKFQAGSTLTTIAQSFAKSSEFKNRYGTVSNQQYVKLVYENVFDRQPDTGGLNFWTGKLDRGEISRGGVIVQFSESSEGVRRLAGPTNLTLLSLAMLRAVPSAATWNSLYPTLALGETRAGWIAHMILVSAAYDARIT